MRNPTLPDAEDFGFLSKVLSDQNRPSQDLCAQEGLRDPGQGLMWYRSVQMVEGAEVREDFPEKGAKKCK